MSLFIKYTFSYIRVFLIGKRTKLSAYQEYLGGDYDRAQLAGKVRESALDIGLLPSLNQFLSLDSISNSFCCCPSDAQC